MSRTCWRSCAGPKTRATASPPSACCSSCPASAPEPPGRYWTRPRWQARGPARRAPPAAAPSTGRDWSELLELCDGTLADPARAGACVLRSAAGGDLRLRLDAPRRSRPARASGRDLSSRERFLTDLALDPPQASGGAAGPPQKDEDYLILSTIHSAKGQEWRAVFVLNLVDGCIPSDMATGPPDEHRGGAAAALRRHDPGARPAAPCPAGALLCHRPGEPRRPPCSGAAHPLHPERPAAPLRPYDAGERGDARTPKYAIAAEYRHRRGRQDDVGLEHSIISANLDAATFGLPAAEIISGCAGRAAGRPLVPRNA